MDATEMAALVALTHKPVWTVDELPPDIDADVYRVLDEAEYIQARGVIMDHGNPQAPVPRPLEWHSPSERFAANGGECGWDAVLTHRKDNNTSLWYEVRVTEKGKGVAGQWKRAQHRGRAPGRKPLRKARKGPPPKAHKDKSLPFIPTPFQRLILQKLDGKAMRTDALGNAVGDRRRLYKSNGIKELAARAMVKRHPRIGYYRPDAPPPEHAHVLGPPRPGEAPKGH